MPTFHFNEIYEPVFFTKARYIDIWGGRARGGSHFATDYFLNLITQPTYFRGYLMREIFGDIRGSLWRDIMDRIEDNETIDRDDFEINESQMSIKCKSTGNIISSKGFKKSSGKQTAKLKSIAGATHVIIEECEEIEKDDFEKLDNSLRTTKTENIQIFRLWNPPDINHWLITENFVVNQSEYPGFYYASPIPGREHLHLEIHSTYLDNYENINSSLLSKIDRVKDQFENAPDPYKRDAVKYEYLVQYKGLIPQTADDVVFKYWDTYTALPDYCDFKVYGIDFGFTNDPAAIVELNICDSTQELFSKEWLYKTGLTNPDLAEFIINNIPDHEDYYFVCDSAEQKSIVELRMLGINAIAAEKGPDSIKFGISKIKQYKEFIHVDSLNLQNEKKNYKYVIDKDSGQVTNIPVDKYNHLIDPQRYALTKFRR